MLQLKNITKRFGTVLANDHIDITVEPGTNHANVGENGARKSTAMRVAYGIEIEPNYVDVAIRRWEKLTGKTAVHAETGETFTEVAARRRAEQLAEQSPEPASVD